jgi:hypothetical protein
MRKRWIQSLHCVVDMSQQLEFKMIEADYDTLVKQAGMTADSYFDKAIESLTIRFGKNYTADHPELIIAYTTICTADYSCSVMAVALQDAADILANAIQDNFNLSPCERTDCCSK